MGANNSRAITQTDAIARAQVSIATTGLSYPEPNPPLVCVHLSYGSIQALLPVCVYRSVCFTLHMHVCVLVLLLPAVDDLVHVVLGGEPIACLLSSSPLFRGLVALLPLPSIGFLQHEGGALAGPGRP